MVDARPNPPWVNRLFTEWWDRIETRVGRPMMPVEATGSGGRKRYVEEYGCGHYGCVMPTGTSGIVVKLTTDALEAHFVAAALRIGHFPEGIVKYDRIYRLSNAQHRNRSVYVLWREEAHDVGSVPLSRWHRRSGWFTALDESQQRDVLQFANRLGAFQTWARIFKESFDRAESPKVYAQLAEWHSWAMDRVSLDDVEEAERYGEPMRQPRLPLRFKGGQRMAIALRGCEILAEMMANEPEGYLVGQALEFYMDHGLLLADVHLGNIGRVTRADYGDPILAITDPGHAVPLEPRQDEVKVEEL